MKIKNYHFNNFRFRKKSATYDLVYDSLNALVGIYCVGTVGRYAFKLLQRSLFRYFF